MRVRWWALVWLLSILAAACDAGGVASPPSPSPTTPPPIVESPTTPDAGPTGATVAVIVPNDDDDQLGLAVTGPQAVERTRSERADDLDRVRLVTADGPEFVGDLVALLADEGVDLICVLAPGALPVVLAVAADHPTTRFCVMPASAPELPANVLAIAPRLEEPAYIAGTVAARTSAEVPPGFIAGGGVGDVERIRAAYQRGLDARTPEPVTPFVLLPAPDEETARSFALAQFDAGVTTVFTVAGDADRGVLDAARLRGGLVMGATATLTPDSLAPSESPPAPPIHVLLTYTLDPAPALGLAVDRLLQEWEGGALTVGFAEGALAIRPGGSTRVPEIFPEVERLVTDIGSGALAPLPAT